MTDEKKPDFTVVDRRRAKDGDDNGDTAPEPIEDQQAASAESTATTLDTESEPPEEAADGERFEPDPTMLLSYCAAQVDTRTLARVLMAVFDSHAWRNMGLIGDPRTGEQKEDLPAAQLAIDCVQFLLGKVETEFSESDRREAQRRLSDLRINYVAKLRP